MGIFVSCLLSTTAFHTNETLKPSWLRNVWQCRSGLSNQMRMAIYEPYNMLSVSSIGVILTFVVLHGELATSLKKRNTPCEQLRTCECVFPNGQGYNLTSLTQRMFMFDDNKHNYSFIFNPCRDPLEPSDCPNMTSICYWDKTKENFTSLGFISETSFLSNGSFVSLVYNHPPFHTEIHLECAERSKTDFSLYPEGTIIHSNESYSFLLRAPEACLTWLSSDSNSSENGLSTGSVLVILFLVFGSVYLLGGSGANYLLRGAKGWEMIPNRDFWLDLPKLCLDGFQFVVNGCSPPPSYEQI